MAFPIRSVDRPVVLSGQSNGKLSAAILMTTPGLADGPDVRLVAPAARAWRALAAAATVAGIVLQATSAVDSYRPFDVQYAMFHRRYTTQRNTDWEIKVCDGVTYYKRPDVATAACPGTSNHGWGLAVDVADASGHRLDWLLANADRFGWSWELQSEPWHIRYCDGDRIPAAVLAFEEDDMDIPTLWNANTASKDHPVPYIKRIQQISTDSAAAAAGVTVLTATVQTLVDHITAGGGNVDTAALLAGVDERIAALKASLAAAAHAEADALDQ